MSEWVGCSVKLLKRMATKGGAVFDKGEVMVVTSHWRGRLSLCRPGMVSHEIVKTAGHAITGVSRREVELQD
jgi:hypothetical protein